MEELPAVLCTPDALSGPLLELVSRRLRTEGMAALSSFGLRPRHLVALTVLNMMGDPSQHDLGEALELDRTNLVGLLNDLEAAKLIERRRDAADRRKHTVSLTGQGRRRLVELTGALEGVERRVLAPLSPSEQETLRSLLGRVAADATGLGSSLGSS